MSASAKLSISPDARGLQSLLLKLNGDWHRMGLRIFLAIVLAHWAEHLTQAVQVYVLGWPIPESLGVLGMWFPWLVKSEALHYVYALVMLLGFWLLRPGFAGLAARCWTIAFWIQFWHHIEHGLLQAQALLGHNLFESPVPTSIVQLWIPRVELHLIYNSIVFVPMLLGMYFHMFPPPEERTWAPRCSCEVRGAAAH